MTNLARLALCMVAPLGGCLDDAAPGGAASDTAPITDSDASTTTDSTTAADTSSVVDTTTTADTHVAVDTAAPPCGNGVLEAGEACDDGNTCALDGCLPQTCRFEPTVALATLTLSSVGFDLDDQDGDGDLTTGVDNVLGEDGVVAAALNNVIGDFLGTGSVIQLLTLGDVDDLSGDDSVSIAFHQGVDPQCPPQAAPVPWTDPAKPPQDLWSDSRSWSACSPDLLMDDSGIRAAASPALPTAPTLYGTAQRVSLPVGPLGVIDIARGHFEASIALTTSGGLSGLTDGRLGGVIPAEVLYQIDTSSFFPGCPTALHAILAFVGHIDQDAEGDGGRDWVQFSLGGSVPCIQHPVTIHGCCNDGDCDDFVAGADCALDDRIEDGYSAGFAFSANAVRVVGQADGASACAE